MSEENQTPPTPTTTTPCTLFLKFLNIYILFNTIPQIGYTFYQHSLYMQVATDYRLVVLSPPLSEDLNVETGVASIGIFREQYVGTVGEGEEYDTQGCMVWTNWYEFTGTSTKAGEWSYSDFSWKPLSQITQSSISILNNQPKPLYITFQCLAILLTIYNILIEYTPLDYPCSSIRSHPWSSCSKKRIKPSTLSLYMFMSDFCIMPFYLMLGIGYGDRCIQQEAILEVFTPVVCGVMPGVMVGGVGVILGVGYFGVFQAISVCFKGFIIILGGFSNAWFVVSSPLYVSIPIAIKFIVQSSLLIHEHRQQQKQQDEHKDQNTAQIQPIIMIPVQLLTSKTRKIEHLNLFFRQIMGQNQNRNENK